MLDTLLNALGLNNKPLIAVASNADPLVNAIDAPNPLVDLLPNDVLLKILQEVPAPYLIGANAITSTSRKWLQVGQNQSLQEKKTYANLIASCQDDPANARHILSSDILNSLHPDQIIEVASYCPQIAIKLIDKSFVGYRPIQVGQLGSKHLEVALHILNKKLECHLGMLGAHRLEIAEAILDKASTDESINGTIFIYLLNLAIKHREIFKRILANNSFKQKISRSNWLVLLTHYPEYSPIIFADPDLNLSFADFVDLANKDTSLGVMPVILENEHLRQQLTSAQWVSFVSDYFPGAEQIFGEDYFKQKFTFDEFIAKMLTDDSLKQKFSFQEWMLVGYKDFKIAQHMLENEFFRQQFTTKDLSRFFRDHPQLRHKILEDNYLKQKLDIDEWDMMICTGQLNLELARKIFADDYFKQKLSIREWLNIGKAHLEIAHAMITSDYFKKLLTVDDLIYLGTYHDEIAHPILEGDPSILQRLTNAETDRVRIMLKSPFSIAKCIQQHVHALNLPQSNIEDKLKEVVKENDGIMVEEQDELEQLFRTWRFY